MWTIVRNVDPRPAGKSKSGQSTLDYMMLFTAIVALVIIFLARDGMFGRALLNALTVTVQSMADISQRVGGSGGSTAIPPGPTPTPCFPTTCDILGMTCGVIEDGCGHYLICGPTCTAVPFCGNGVCESGETCMSCGVDCPTCCGDGVCDGPERVECLCSADCSVVCVGGCGDGVCDPLETCYTCPIDCPNCCGDGRCYTDGGDEDCIKCPADCGTCLPGGMCGDLVCDPDETCQNCEYDCLATCCGNGTCDAFVFENFISCPADCTNTAVCGDYTCDVGETAMNPPMPDYIYCPEDCEIAGSLCGNGICEPSASEDFRDCLTDCPLLCGNGFCNPYLGENYVTCPQDCPVPSAICGDGICAAGESCRTCAPDCPTCCGDGVVLPTIDLCDNCPEELPGCTSVCGNGYCEEYENCFNCRQDCAQCCGDGLCWDAENCTTCPYDCYCEGLLCGEPGFDCSGQCGRCDDCSPCCGDGVIDPGEVCDTFNLGGMTCDRLLGTGGTLSCSYTCTSFDVSGCI